MGKFYDTVVVITPGDVGSNLAQGLKSFSSNETATRKLSALGFFISELFHKYIWRSLFVIPLRAETRF